LPLPENRLTRPHHTGNADRRSCTALNGFSPNNLYTFACRDWIPRLDALLPTRANLQGADQPTLFPGDKKTPLRTRWARPRPCGRGRLWRLLTWGRWDGHGRPQMVRPGGRTWSRFWRSRG